MFSLCIKLNNNVCSFLFCPFCRPANNRHWQGYIVWRFSFKSIKTLFIFFLARGWLPPENASPLNCSIECQKQNSGVCGLNTLHTYLSVYPSICDLRKFNECNVDQPTSLWIDAVSPVSWNTTEESCPIGIRPIWKQPNCDEPCPVPLWDIPVCGKTISSTKQFRDVCDLVKTNCENMGSIFFHGM